MKEKEERTKTAKKAAKISWDNRKKNNGIKGDANAMQEQCGSNAIKGKESKVKGKNNIFPADSVEYELSNLLLLKILENNPNVKKPDLQLWSKEMDLMIRCDNRNVEDIRKAIEWCQSDNFWKGNILSVTKLRKNFDQLTAKMNNSCKKPGTMGGLSLARMQ